MRENFFKNPTGFGSLAELLKNREKVSKLEDYQDILPLSCIFKMHFLFARTLFDSTFPNVYFING